MMDWDAWEPQAPPRGFAEAVASAVQKERGKHRRAVRGRLYRASAWLALAAAIGTSAVLALQARAPAPGDVHARMSRQEVQVGAHGQAVLEPGAHVSWNQDDVTQDKGDVFYRVEPGRTMRVHTPMADVELNGACVRVKVAGKVAADSGHALPMALITVYEGAAAVSDEHERIDLAAGEAAVATPNDVRRARGGFAGEEAFERDGVAPAAADAGPAAAAPPREPYEVTSERWAELEKQGRVEYWLPWCSSAKDWTAKPEYLAKLELQPEDAPLLTAAYAHSRARVWAAVKPLCAPLVGGAEGAEKLGPKTCIQLVLENANNADPGIVEDASRLVAQLELMLRPPIQPDEQIDAVTKLLIVLTRELDEYEAELTPELGTDAHRIARGPDGCHWQDDATKVGSARHDP